MARNTNGAVRRATDHAAAERLSVDCDRCPMQHTDACDDCIVTFLCADESSPPMSLIAVEERR